MRPVGGGDAVGGVVADAERRELILIRHAESAPDFSVPAHEWGLTERGRRQAQELAAAAFWPSVSLLLVSDEPKALATAEPAARRHGLRLETTPALREVRRPAGRLDDFAEAVRRYLERQPEAPPDWESADAAARRVAECLDEALAHRPDSTIAAVSHGTVLTLYLERLLGRDRAHEVWSGMGFGSCTRVDLERRALVSDAG